MPDHLRAKLIHLANTHPEFRAELLPLLKASEQNTSDYWYSLEPKKPGVTASTLKAGQGRCSLQEKRAAWENLPNGWTSESVQSMWDTMTEGVKHKITKCMEKMEGKVDDAGAFCGSLSAQVGYKRASNTSGDATLLRKAIIQVAHENPNLRTTLLPCILRRA